MLPLIASGAAAKSPPPGTGADDVPANILLVLDTSGSMSTPAGEANVSYPMDIAFDSLGNFYVTKYFDTIEKYNAAGEFQLAFGGYNGTDDDGMFDLTFAVAVDSDNNVYVADTHHGRIQKFDPSGNFITKMNLAASPAQGVAVDSNDNIYAINGSGNVQKFTKTGTLLQTWSNTNGYHITVDASDNVYITQRAGKKIDTYDTSGNFVSSFNVTFKPGGIDADSNGDLYIGGTNTAKVYKYSPAGTELAQYGGFGTGTGQYYATTGVAVASDDKAYTADFLLHRVQDTAGVLLVDASSLESRLDVAKNVIKTIVSDSDLTGGANFGLIDWDTTATLITQVSDTGASEIFNTIDTLIADGGTELDNAMDLAEGYLLGPDTPIIPGASCQETIIIVISDGFWTDTTASDTAESLFQNEDIRTFVVGFATAGNSNYVTLSDKGGSSPDSPLYASNEDALLEVLSSYIQQVISSQLTFSAPTIIPSVVNDDSILQSTFTFKNDHQWKGHLLKYAINSDGTIGSQLWDAGSVMNLTPAANRNIWTLATGININLNNFVTANLDRLRAPLEEYSGSAYTDQDLIDLIEFVRGMDSYNEYPTGVDDEGTTLLTGERWKLADIYHSKATVVGAPSAFVSDETNVNGESYYRHINGYKAFTQSTACGSICSNREEIIFAGSNAGMIHAFSSSTGQEKWAFIPPSVLPQLKNMISLQAGESNAIYGVDGSPIVKDVYISGQWKTVLMAGLRQGGHSYFALDVTDPDNPQHLFTFDSRPSENTISYWDAAGVRTDYDTTGSVPAEYNFSELGESWSQPVILKMKIGPDDKWVAVIAGGHNNTINPAYGAKLYVLDLEDGGKIIQSLTIADTNGSNNIVNAVPPKVTAITADSTTLFPFAGAMVYVTDLEGKLWKVNLTDQGTLYDVTAMFDAEATYDNDRMGYHNLASTITSDLEIMHYYGTADIQRLGRVDANIQNRAYGIIDNDFPNYSPVGTFTTTSLQDTTSGANCPSGSQKGWYINFDANEKMAAKATVKNGVVFLPRYTPDAADICAAGSAKLSEVNYMCGDTIRDIDLGTGVPTEVIVYENTIYAGISSDADDGTLTPGFIKQGNLITGTPSVPTLGKVRIESWREDF